MKSFDLVAEALASCVSSSSALEIVIVVALVVVHCTTTAQGCQQLVTWDPWKDGWHSASALATKEKIHIAQRL